MPASSAGEPAPWWISVKPLEVVHHPLLKMSCGVTSTLTNPPTSPGPLIDPNDWESEMDVVYTAPPMISAAKPPQWAQFELETAPVATDASMTAVLIVTKPP